MEEAKSDSSKSSKPSKQVSMEALLCESDNFAPWINVSEKYDVASPCDGKGMDIVDCKHPEKQRFIDDCGSLDMSTKTIAQKTPIIAEEVPVVPREFFQQPPQTIPQQVVGINLKDILHGRVVKEAGFYHPPRQGIEVNDHALEAPIFEGKNVVLFCGGIDTLIEHLWFRREVISLYDKIAGMGFYAVTGMNFSLFHGECPFGHALNINKTLLFCHELDKRGVRVIPNIYAINDAQRQKWADHINANPSVGQIMINQQLQRNASSVANEDNNIRFLLEHTDVNILLQGRRYPLPPDLLNHLRIQHATSGSLKRAVMTGRVRSTELVTLSSLPVSEQSGSLRGIVWSTAVSD